MHVENQEVSNTIHTGTDKKHIVRPINSSQSVTTIRLLQLTEALCNSLNTL